MKEQIGILGIGQAGSNIALEFERLGYNCLYLNTSKEDLDSLRYVKHKLHIKGGEGASKNRKAVLKLAAESIDDILSDIISVLPQEYIMILFSAGGGTGSGLSPVVASYLTQIKRKVVLGVVLPNDFKESPRTCENAYNACVELSGLNNIGAMFFLDNNNVKDKFELNNIFAKDIDNLLNLNNCSKYGNIDKSEIKTILNTSGLTVITRQSKARSTASFIIEGLTDNIYTKIENKAPIFVGISTTNKSLDFDDLYREIGYPYDDFRGISDTNTLCVACGYQLPMGRLEMLKNKAQKVQVVRESLVLNKLGEQVITQQSVQQKLPTSNRDLILQFINN